MARKVPSRITAKVNINRVDRRGRHREGRISPIAPYASKGLRPGSPRAFKVYVWELKGGKPDNRDGKAAEHSGVSTGGAASRNVPEVGVVNTSHEGATARPLENVRRRSWELQERPGGGKGWLGAGQGGGSPRLGEIQAGGYGRGLGSTKLRGDFFQKKMKKKNGDKAKRLFSPAAKEVATKIARTTVDGAEETGDRGPGEDLLNDLYENMDIPTTPTKTKEELTRDRELASIDMMID